MKRMRVLAAIAVFVLGCASGGLSSIEDLMSGVGGSGGLSNGTIAAGLKEALEVGTQSAVSQTSREGGFSDNPLIRIALPESLQTMAKGLRLVGFGSQVDELELAMNRSAERAASEATAVFWSAIKQMTFSDVRAIWHGDETAATNFLDRTTRPQLRERFEPIVTEKMSQVGLSRLYDEMLGRYTALPFAKKPQLELQGYVTEGALDGLFEVLGEEERKIRQDPGARTTALLRRVFG